MKPLYIRMQAFGSYQQAEIDFADMQNGLFLITGDTGAGKTTIFDAITFALFDETSGGKRSGEMMRSQYARQDLVTEVEFRFLYYDQVYTIIRRPRQEKFRAKTNDDGTVVYEKNKTPLGPDVELVLPDGTSYPGKKTETDKKIREIIGLDAAQFTQIAMLAQGDFMKLLQASSKDRMEIFAKIFDTRIYQAIEQELMNRAKESNIALKRSEEVIDMELKRLRLMENSAYTEQFEEGSQFRASAKADEVMAFIQRLLAEAEKQQTSLAAQDEANRAKYEELRAALANAETFNASWDKYQGFLRKKEELDYHQDAMKCFEEQLALGKKADAVRIEELRYIERKGEADNCRNVLQTMQNSITTLEKACKDLAPLAAEKQALYEKEQPQLSGEIARIEAMYPQYARYEASILQKQQQQKACAVLEKEYHEREQAIQAKNEEKQKLLQQKAQLEQNVDYVEVLEAEIRVKKELAGELNHLSVALKDLEEAKAEGRKLRAQASEADRRQKEEEEQYNQLYQQFIDSQAAILARSLKEGEPCPVCGSRHHEPVVHTQGRLVESHTLKAAQEKLDAVRKKAQNAGEALLQAITAYKAGEQDVIKNGKKYYDDAFQTDRVTQLDIEERRQTVLGEVKQLEERKNRAEQNQQSLQACIKRLQELEDELLRANEEYQAKNRELQEAQVALEGLRTTAETLKQQLLYETEAQARLEADMRSRRLKALKTELETAQDAMQKQKAQLQEAQGAFQTQESVLKNLTDKQSVAYRLFVQAVESQGFASEDAYRACIMAADVLEQTEHTLRDYRQQVQENGAQIRTLEEEMKGKERQDTTACKAQIDALQKQMEESRHALTRLYSIIENNREVAQKVEVLYKKRETMLLENALLRNLDNTANGKLSGKHLKFQTYIQRRYFKQIVDNANKRLYIMSNSQFILQCRDTDALGSQGFVGLDLDVYSIVNDQTRDVKTLSGGESFMAALALALGMADMIQNSTSSVHIDTMFIDEGFGSLSEETRNQAISILNGLSGGKRLVGIISHVTELKNQIDRKLIVTKTEKGSKAVWDLLM